MPRWYDRDERGLPNAWLETMRRAMASSLWLFSTTRMLEEYTERLYLPAAREEAAEVPVVVGAQQR